MRKYLVHEMCIRDVVMSQVHNLHLMQPGVRLDEPAGQFVPAVVQQVKDFHFLDLLTGHFLLPMATSADGILTG